MSPDEIGLVRKLWEPVKCSFENSLPGSSLEVDHGLSTNPDLLHRIGGGLHYCHVFGTAQQAER